MTDAFECGHPKTADNTVTVRKRYHYCRICNRQSANRRYRGHHPGAKQKAFTSLDAKLETLIRKSPGHWLWQGSMRDGAIAVCAHEGELVFVAQLLWTRKYGEVPDRHCLYRICPLSRCVHPECHKALVRGSHITGEQSRQRWVPADRKLPPQIYGMSPERAAIFGLIDDEQYMSRYGA